jgi:hypothetical protein
VHIAGERHHSEKRERLGLADGAFREGEHLVQSDCASRIEPSAARAMEYKPFRLRRKPSAPAWWARCATIASMEIFLKKYF